MTAFGYHAKITALCCEVNIQTSYESNIAGLPAICTGIKLKEDRETKERLLESAKREFLEKGYMKASLRSICAKAGVTTGALYFFFKDKEELFGALVDAPVDQLFQLLYQHFDEESKMLAHQPQYEHANGDHDIFAETLVRYLYDHYEAFFLLIKKSQGSRYEDFPDRITVFLEKRYFAFMSDYAAEHHLSAPNAFLVHFIVHACVDLLVQLLLYEKDVEKAVSIQKKLLEFIVGGCMKLVF